jgi:hypothetical protein
MNKVNDPLAEAYDLLSNWMDFIDDEFTFNHIEDHNHSYESDTNAHVLESHFVAKVDSIITRTNDYLQSVCKLCGGSNDHGSKCEQVEVEETPF